MDAPIWRRITLTTLGVLQYIGPSLQFMIGVWLLGEAFDRGLRIDRLWPDLLALVLFTLEGAWRQRRVFRLNEK